MSLPVNNVPKWPWSASNESLRASGLNVPQSTQQQQQQPRSGFNAQPTREQVQRMSEYHQYARLFMAGGIPCCHPPPQANYTLGAMFGSNNTFGGYSSNSYGNNSSFFAPPPPPTTVNATPSSSNNNNNNGNESWSNNNNNNTGSLFKPSNSLSSINNNNSRGQPNYRGQQQPDNLLLSDSLYGYTEENSSSDVNVGALETGVSGLNLDNGQQRSGNSYANLTSSSSGGSAAAAAGRKTTSWASVASQPVKLQPKSLKSKMGGGLLGAGGGSKHLPPTVTMDAAWEGKNSKIPPPVIAPSATPPVIEPQDISPLVIDDPELPPPGGYPPQQPQQQRGSPPSSSVNKDGRIPWLANNGRNDEQSNSSPNLSPRVSYGGNAYNNNSSNNNNNNKGRRDSVEDYSSNEGSVGAYGGGRYNNGSGGGYNNYRNNNYNQPPNNYNNSYNAPPPNNYGPRDRDMGGPRDRDIGGPRDRDIGGPRDRDMVGPRDRDMSGPRDRDMVGPRDRDMVGPRDRDMGGPRDRDYGPPSRDRYQNDSREMGYGGPNQSMNYRDYNNASPPVTRMDPAALEKLQEAMKNVNPKEMELELTGARFFIIKSYSEDDIHRSIKYSIWCSTEHGNKRLDQAYRQQLEVKAPIFLFFSVNRSGHFCGIAQMVSPVDYNASSGVWSQDKWKGQFQVKWLYVKDVPNDELRHITLENNENKPVTHSRDTQEVFYDKGRKVLAIIHTYQHRTSLFDDFLHYEAKQEEEEQMCVRPMANHSPPPMGDGRGDGGNRGGYTRNNMPPPYRGPTSNGGLPQLSADNRYPPSSQYNNRSNQPPPYGGQRPVRGYDRAGDERGGGRGDYRDGRDYRGGDGYGGPRRGDYRGDYDYGGGRGDYHRDRDFHPPPPPAYRGAGGGGSRDYREPPPQPRQSDYREPPPQPRMADYRDEPPPQPRASDRQWRRE